MIKKIKELLANRNVAVTFRTPKSFISGEVFKYATLALLPGYLLSLCIGFYNYSLVNVVTYPIFIFYAIFWGLVSLNNKAYKRDRETLEHLIVANKIDCIELIAKFTAEIPANSQPTTIGPKPSQELIFLMKSIFSFNEKELAESFVLKKGNVLSWLSTLDLPQREVFYRYYI